MFTFLNMAKKQDDSIPLLDRKSKKIYIEFLRIIAIYFVIFNHTGKNGYFLFSLFPDNSIQYWLYLFLSVFCKFSVPLFFAISGSLLLTRDEPISVIWINRILKICVVLLLISFLYYLKSTYRDLSKFSLKSFCKTLYESSMSFHLWYLYVFIPFLASLPLLRPFVQNLRKEHFYYLFICALFFLAFMPVVEYLLWQGRHTFNSRLKMEWVTTNYILYPCLGYFLEHKIDIKKTKQWILPLWIINILTILISCYMTFYKARITGVCKESSSQAFHSIFVIINVTALFITAKYFFTSYTISKIITNMLCSIGSATFGIYLLHIMFLSPLTKRLWPLRSTLHSYPMVFILIVCSIVLMVSYAVTLIIKKIPVLNKLI